jgi:hypothetical protein
VDNAADMSTPVLDAQTNYPHAAATVVKWDTQEKAVQTSPCPPKCLNCKGPHDATSRQCPKYLAEVCVCHLTADEGLSFAAARAKIQADVRNPVSSATVPCNPASTSPLHNSNNHQNNTPTTAPHNLDLDSLKAFITLTQLIAEDSPSYIPPYQIPPNEPSWNRGPPSTLRTLNPPMQASSPSLPPLHHSNTQTPSSTQMQTRKTHNQNLRTTTMQTSHRMPLNMTKYTTAQ